jgi:hypothetical protein
MHENAFHPKYQSTPVVPAASTVTAAAQDPFQPQRERFCVTAAMHRAAPQHILPPHISQKKKIRSLGTGKIHWARQTDSELNMMAGGDP